MKLFIGTNFGHGSAVAALDEGGKLIFAAEEGRLTGIKDCDGFPIIALRTLLNNFPSDAVLWAEGWDRWKRFIHKGLGTTLKYGFFDRSYFRARLLKEVYRVCAGLQAEFKWQRVLNTPSFAGHHLSHAFSLLPWGLPAKSVIIISDTTAESAALSIFYWSGSNMQALLEVPYPHSLGAAFHQMAVHLGFLGRTAPGKLMALAAYGQPKWVDELNSICDLTNRGLRFVLDRFPAWRRKNAWRIFAANSASSTLRDEIERNLGRGEEGSDLARSVQDWFTITSLKVIKDALRIARDCYGLDVKHIGLAGGAALNCQANGYILSACPSLDIESVTVSPWSDDPGTAIGAAAWLFNRATGQLPSIIPDSFLGPPALSDLQSGGITNCNIQKAARVLQDGGIVALVSGNLEFGPRALGNRCLLGDPRSIQIRDRLNNIKGRPRFMPFAPVVLESDFNLYFNGEGSTNMAWTVKSTSRAVEEIPAAIHINGEARAQILKEQPHTLLWRLLTSFRALTGVGVLLLTSLNGKGEPIAANMGVAAAMVRRMGVGGMISDSGWYS